MTVVNPASSASVPSSRDPLIVLTQGNVAPNSSTLTPAPSAADLQVALSIVVEAAEVFRNGFDLKARNAFKDALADSWKDLSAGQGTALRGIAARLCALTDACSSKVCRSTIETFLATVPGGLAGQSYSPKDGMFGA